MVYSCVFGNAMPCTSVQFEKRFEKQFEPHYRVESNLSCANLGYKTVTLFKIINLI